MEIKEPTSRLKIPEDWFLFAFLMPMMSFLVSGGCLAAQLWSVSRVDGARRALAGMSVGLLSWAAGSLALALAAVVVRLLAPVQWIKIRADDEGYGMYRGSGFGGSIEVEDPRNSRGAEKIDSPLSRTIFRGTGMLNAFLNPFVLTPFAVVLAILSFMDRPDLFHFLGYDWSIKEIFYLGGGLLLVVLILWDGIYKVVRMNRPR